MTQKDKAITKHIKKRFKQRFDINSNHYMRAKIISAIQNNECEMVHKTSNSRSIYRVKIGNRAVDVVYDCRRKKIVTALYPAKECDHDWLELSQEEARKQNIYHAGMCYHVCVCTKCGKVWAYDSSG